MEVNSGLVAHAETMDGGAKPLLFAVDFQSRFEP
jgi:hypothetical protein